MSRPRYTYRDLMTNRKRWTSATFAGWTKKSGPLGINYAVFHRHASTLLIPRYLLTKETLDSIGRPERIEP